MSCFVIRELTASHSSRDAHLLVCLAGMNRSGSGCSLTKADRAAERENADANNFLHCLSSSWCSGRGLSTAVPALHSTQNRFARKCCDEALRFGPRIVASHFGNQRQPKRPVSSHTRVATSCPTPGL